MVFSNNQVQRGLSTHLIASRKTIPRQRVFSDVLRLSIISSINSVNLMSSRLRANHLYCAFLSDQARVKRVWSEVGISGRYLGSAATTRERRVSW